MTDVEDLERRKNVVTSPCMWVRQEGTLLYDATGVDGGTNRTGGSRTGSAARSG